jgi:hypothetical protein
MIRKSVLTLAALAALTLGGLYAWGLSLPATTRTQRIVRLAASPEQVHAKISDIAGQSAWRSDIGRIAVSADGARWTEYTQDGSTIDFELIESRPGALFAIAYRSSLGFEGKWRARLAPDGRSTRGAFAEDLTIANPFMRAVGQLVSPPGQHLDLYLSDLKYVLGS